MKVHELVAILNEHDQNQDVVMFDPNMSMLVEIGEVTSEDSVLDTDGFRALVNDFDDEIPNEDTRMSVVILRETNEGPF